MRSFARKPNEIVDVIRRRQQRRGVEGSGSALLAYIHGFVVFVVVIVVGRDRRRVAVGLRNGRGRDVATDVVAFLRLSIGLLNRRRNDGDFRLKCDAEGADVDLRRCVVGVGCHPNGVVTTRGAVSVMIHGAVVVDGGVGLASRSFHFPSALHSRHFLPQTTPFFAPIVHVAQQTLNLCTKLWVVIG